MAEDMVGRSPDGHLHDGELLSAALGQAGGSVRGHLRGCPGCRTELGEWAAIRAGAVVATAPLYRPIGVEVAAEVAAAVVAAAGRREPDVFRPAPVVQHDSRARLAWAARLLHGQLPLLRLSIVTASLLMFLVGVLGVVAGGADHGADLLAALAPVAVAAGLALVHGPEVDPAAELVAATPTSPRILLLARLVLVTALGLVLAFAATVATWLAGSGVAFGGLVASWFGPLLLLSALSLWLAVTTRPAIGLAGALTLWLVRLAAMPYRPFDLLVPRAPDHLEWYADAWRTSVPTVAVALSLIALAVVIAPSRARLAAG
jgi:hypothetical protein